MFGGDSVLGEGAEVKKLSRNKGKRASCLKRFPGRGRSVRPKTMYASIFQCHGWISGPKF
ncbi:MAG TPA: hypothetical protein DDZ83_16005 [Nitrospinae bacterium]|nr:hypothetical protein [Nitrospinota bacterium]